MATNQELLLARESGGDYQAQNKYGYIGGYQMGAASLYDSGYVKKKPKGVSQEEWLNNDKAWIGKNGVNSKASFMENPEAQDVAFGEYQNKLWTQLESKGADKFLGKDIDGVKITKDGLLRSAHLLGAGGTNKALNKGDLTGATDAFKTSAKDYMSLGNDSKNADVNPGMSTNEGVLMGTEQPQQPKEEARMYSGFRNAGGVLNNAFNSAVDFGKNAVMSEEEKRRLAEERGEGVLDQYGSFKDQSGNNSLSLGNSGAIASDKGGMTTGTGGLGGGYGVNGFGMNNVNPLSVAGAEGALISGTLGDQSGAKVTGGALGQEEALLSDMPQGTDWGAMASAVGKGLVSNKKKQGARAGTPSVSFAPRSSGGGSLGSGKGFNDFFGG